MNARRSRRYKMRRPMFAFGQLMLPIVGIIAVGLLVIGVKLFFLPTSKGNNLYQPDVIRPVTISPSVSSQPEKAEALPSPGMSAPRQNGEDFIAIPITQPQAAGSPPVSKPKPDGRKPSGEKGTVSTQGSEKHVATVPFPVNGNWAVQIGAFTEKKQAEQLAMKAKQEGYTVFVAQGNVKGVLYYRVRVAAGTNRSEAADLEKRLKASGYPTYVVPNN